MKLGSILFIAATTSAPLAHGRPQGGDCDGNGVPDFAEVLELEAEFPNFGIGRDVDLFGSIAVVTRDIAPLQGGIDLIDISLPFSPVPLAQFSISNAQTYGVEVVGTHAYLANYTAVVDVDIANPSLPQIVASAPMPGGGTAMGIDVHGSVCYVAAGSAGLAILETFDLAAGPITTVPTAGFARDVAARGNLVLVADQPAGLTVVFAKKPAFPLVLTTVPSPGDPPEAVAFDGNLAYVAFGSDGLYIYDVSDPLNPVGLSSLSFSATALDVEVEGRTAYVATLEGGLQVVDVTNPEAPRLVDRVSSAVYSAAPHAEIAVLGGPDFEIASIASIRPSLTNFYLNLPGFAPFGSDVTTFGTLGFVSQGLYGMDVLDLSAPGWAVHIGDYDPVAPITEVTSFHSDGEAGYAVDRSYGFVAFDLADPRCPSVVASLALAGGAQAMAIDGNRAYVASAGAGLAIIDITVPENPIPFPSVIGPSPSAPVDLVVEGSVAYLFEDDRLRVVDVSDPLQPAVTATVVGATGDWRHGALIGPYLIRLGDDSLQPFDVRDPAQVQPVGPGLALPGGSQPSDLEIYGTFGIVGFENLGELWVVDLTDPAAPNVNPLSIHLGIRQFARRGRDLIAIGAFEDVGTFELAFQVQPDCNDNGLPDACDIAFGILDDDDLDGLPNSCEANLATADCSGVSLSLPSLACLDPSTAVQAPAMPILPFTDQVERVSLDPNGDEIFVAPIKFNKGSSHPSVSDDGNVVAWSNEVPLMCGQMMLERKQVFARIVSDQRTILISGRDDSLGPMLGTADPGCGPADNPAVSGDGRYIAFSSGEALPGEDMDNQCVDIFLHDLLSGKTTRVSENPCSGVGGDSDSTGPLAISYDGRFVAFESIATNLMWPDICQGLVPEPQDKEDDDPLSNVFLYDANPGEQPTIEWISVGRDGEGNCVLPDGASRHPSMSRDGCRIAFDTDATNLSTVPSPGGRRIVLHERASGRSRIVDRGFEPCSATVAQTMDFYGTSQRPSISDDGRWIAFESIANNLAPETTTVGPPTLSIDDTNPLYDIHFVDVETGIVSRLDLEADFGFAADRSNALPQLSSDGRFVVFTRTGDLCQCENLFELYLVDRDRNSSGLFDQPGNTDWVRLSDRPSADAAGAGMQANRLTGGNADITADGQFVVYMSEASDLLPPTFDANGDLLGCENQTELCQPPPFDPQCDNTPRPQCPLRWGRDVFRRRVY